MFKKYGEEQYCIGVIHSPVLVWEDTTVCGYYLDKNTEFPSFPHLHFSKPHFSERFDLFLTALWNIVYV